MTSTTAVDRPESYRIDHPTIRVVMSDMLLPGTDLGPGDRIPSFDLPTTDGGGFRSADLTADDQPVLLVFGSLTCPVTARQHPPGGLADGVPRVAAGGGAPRPRAGAAHDRQRVPLGRPLHARQDERQEVLRRAVRGGRAAGRPRRRPRPGLQCRGLRAR